MFRSLKQIFFTALSRSELGTFVQIGVLHNGLRRVLRSVDSRHARDTAPPGTLRDVANGSEAAAQQTLHHEVGL